MNDKEKVDAYISLYKQQMQHFEKMSDIEWKGNFGIWTLLTAGIYFASQRQVPVPAWASGIGLLALAVLHGLWLHRMHDSERFDKRLFSRYRAEARHLLLGPAAPSPPDPFPQDELEFTGRNVGGRLLSLILGVAITAGLATLLWFVVAHGPVKTAQEAQRETSDVEQKNSPPTQAPAAVMPSR